MPPSGGPSATADWEPGAGGRHGSMAEGTIPSGATCGARFAVGSARLWIPRTERYWSISPTVLPATPRPPPPALMVVVRRWGGQARRMATNAPPPSAAARVVAARQTTRSVPRPLGSGRCRGRFCGCPLASNRTQPPFLTDEVFQPAGLRSGGALQGAGAASRYLEQGAPHAEHGRSRSARPRASR